MFTIDELNLANQEAKTIHITKALDELYELANSKRVWTDYEKTLIRAHFKNGYGLFMFALFKHRVRYVDLLKMYMEEVEIPRLKEERMRERVGGGWWVVLGLIGVGALLGRCIY